MLPLNESDGDLAVGHGLDVGVLAVHDVGHKTMSKAAATSRMCSWMLTIAMSQPPHEAAPKMASLGLRVDAARRAASDLAVGLIGPPPPQAPGRLRRRRGRPAGVTAGRLPGRVQVEAVEVDDLAGRPVERSERPDFLGHAGDLVGQADALGGAGPDELEPLRLDAEASSVRCSSWKRRRAL